MEQLLIVEDDRDLNQGLCKALKTDGRQIVSCTDLRSAREQLALASPALVLLDRIWTGGAEFVEENALSVTVKRLRDKLGAQKTIQTVYGIGYTWVKENG